MAQGQSVASCPGRSTGVPLEPPHQTLPKDPASRHVPREGQASRCEFALTRPESRQQNPISPIPHRQPRSRQDRRARGIEGRLQAPQHRRSNVGHWRGCVERQVAKLLCLQRFPSFLAGISLPRGGGPREDLRLLLLERRSAVQARSAALNQLRALLVTAPDHLRKQLETRSGKRLAKAAARLSPGKTTVSDVMRRLGRRISHLSDELAETEHALAELAPDLLNECGVGPVCAAQLLVSTGNPARMRNEPPSPHSPAPAPSKPQAATSDGTASTAAATANSTGPSTSSHPNGPTTTPKPPATTNDSSQPAKPAEKHAAVSNAPSPATSTNASAKYQPTP